MNAPVVMPDRLKATPHVGPVDWRRMVQWLSDDKVISHEEAQRTIARCSQAESAQHALVRLANVAMARAEVIQERWGLPATKWLRVFKPVA